MPYPDIFYYYGKTNQPKASPVYTGSEEPDLELMAAGSSNCWVEMMPTRQKKNKALVLADWTAYRWNKQKLKQVKKVLYQLIADGFPLYIWHNKSVIELTREHIDKLEDHFPLKKISPQSPLDIKAKTEKCSRYQSDEIHVIDDHWIDFLIDDIINKKNVMHKPRALDLSNVVNLGGADRVSFYAMADKVVPKIENLVLTEFPGGSWPTIISALQAKSLLAQNPVFGSLTLLDYQCKNLIFKQAFKDRNPNFFNTLDEFSTIITNPDSDTQHIFYKYFFNGTGSLDLQFGLSPILLIHLFSKLSGSPDFNSLTLSRSSSDPLKHLDLDNLYPIAKQLSTFSISNYVISWSPKGMESFSNLEEFSLNKIEIPIECLLNVLIPARNLKKIKFDSYINIAPYNDVSKKSLLIDNLPVNCLPDLEELTLNSVKGLDLVLTCMLLGNKPNLEKLYIIDCDNVFPLLIKNKINLSFQSLKDLCINNTTDTLPPLDPAFLPSSLNYLTLGKSDLTQLNENLNLSNLMTLNLDSCEFCEDNLANLLSGSRKLKKISIWSSHIIGPILETPLPAQLLHSSLEELEIVDVGPGLSANLFASLINDPKHLNTLNLRKVNISGAFRGTMPLPKLKSIELRDFNCHSSFFNTLFSSANYLETITIINKYKRPLLFAQFPTSLPVLKTLTLTNVSVSANNLLSTTYNSDIRTLEFEGDLKIEKMLFHSPTDKCSLQNINLNIKNNDLDSTFLGKFISLLVKPNNQIESITLKSENTITLNKKLNLDQTKELKLDLPGLTQDDFENFIHHGSNLETLSVSVSNTENKLLLISDPVIKHKLPSLQHLTLSNIILSPAYFNSLIPPSLTSLKLINCGLTEVLPHDFSLPSTIKQLTLDITLSKKDLLKMLRNLGPGQATTLDIFSSRLDEADIDLLKDEEVKTELYKFGTTINNLPLIDYLKSIENDKNNLSSKNKSKSKRENKEKKSKQKKPLNRISPQKKNLVPKAPTVCAHDPNDHMTKEPAIDIKKFQFKYPGDNGTQNQDMIRNKLAQYLFLKNPHKYHEQIYRLATDGICAALAKLFKKKTLDEWDTFITAIQQWNGDSLEDLKSSGDDIYFEEAIRKFNKTYLPSLFDSPKEKLWLGEHITDWLKKWSKQKKSDQSLIFSNCWHAITVKFEGGEYYLYDPNEPQGYRKIALNEIENELRYHLGNLLFVKKSKDIYYKKNLTISNPVSFIREGGLHALLITSIDNSKEMLKNLGTVKNLKIAKGDLEKGLFIRDVKGRPIWALGLCCSWFQNHIKDHICDLIIKYTSFLEPKNPNDYEIFTRSIEKLPAQKKHELITALIKLRKSYDLSTPITFPLEEEIEEDVKAPIKIAINENPDHPIETPIPTVPTPLSLPKAPFEHPSLTLPLQQSLENPKPGSILDLSDKNEFNKGPLINAIRMEERKVRIANRCETWQEKPINYYESLDQYCHHLIDGTLKNRRGFVQKKWLIEMKSTEEVEAFTVHLQQYCENLSPPYYSPVYYIHSPNQVVCSSPYVVKNPDGTGEVREGKGGPLYDFLKMHKDSSPILIINYDRFDADDIVRLNSLIDKKPNADGKNLPAETRVIGIINPHKPDCYKKEDFQPRFGIDGVETCPVLVPLINTPITTTSIPKTKEENLSVFPINFFNARDWKQRLMGRWLMKDGALVFQNGLVHTEEFKTALAAGKSINIQNGPWHDRDFCYFWDRARALHFIECEGERIDITKISLQKSFGYDWETLTSILDNADDELDREGEIINPHLFNSFFTNLQCVDGKLNILKGIINDAAQNHPRCISLNITRELSLDQWARLLNECEVNKVRLNCHFEKNITPPDELKIKLSRFNNPALKNKNIRVIESHDIDVTLHAFEDQDYIIIDVSELNASDLIKKLDGKYIKGRGHCFTYHDSVLTKAINNKQKIILKGKFSAPLADALAPYLIKNQGEIVIISDDTSPFSYMQSEKPENVQQEKINILRKEFGDANIKQLTLNQLENLSLAACRSELIYNTLPIKYKSPWQGMHGLSGEITLKKLAETEDDIKKISDEFIEGRMSAISAILSALPYVYLTGLTGVGKSTFVDKYIEKYYGKKVIFYNGLESLLEWVADPNKILFIDEANLSQKHWSEFEGLFHKPRSILIDGQEHKLSPEHKLIFAGNPINYGGDRFEASLFKNHGGALVFGPMPQEFIYEEILRPVFENTPLENSRFHISKEILKRYKFLCEHSKDKVLISPRELQMIALLIVSYYKDHAEADIDWVTNYYASLISRNLVPDQYKEKFDRLFPKVKVLKPLPEKLKILKTKVRHKDKKIKTEIEEDFVVTDSRWSSYQYLLDILHLRTYRRSDPQLNDAKKSGGIGATIFEGGPGIGKSELVFATLYDEGFEKVNLHTPTSEVRDKAFYHMPSGMKLNIKEALLIKAFEEGAIVVIDEINSFPTMEKILNDLLMGKKPIIEKTKTDKTKINSNEDNKKEESEKRLKLEAENDDENKKIKYEAVKQSRPGFMIIATQNPFKEGRYEQSIALQRRSFTISLPAYTTPELIQILKTKGHSIDDATMIATIYQQKVAEYQTICAENIDNPPTPAPTFRTLIEVAEEDLRHIIFENLRLNSIEPTNHYGIYRFVHKNGNYRVKKLEEDKIDDKDEKGKGAEVANYYLVDSSERPFSEKLISEVINNLTQEDLNEIFRRKPLPKKTVSHLSSDDLSNKEKMSDDQEIAKATTAEIPSIPDLLSKKPGQITSIFDAIRNNDTKLIEKLIAGNPALLTEMDEDGLTPLNLMIQTDALSLKKNDELTKLMIHLLNKHEECLSITDKKGNTILHVAVGHNHLRLTKHIVEMAVKRESLNELLHRKNNADHSPLDLDFKNQCLSNTINENTFNQHLFYRIRTIINEILKEVNKSKRYTTFLLDQHDKARYVRASSKACVRAMEDLNVDQTIHHFKIFLICCMQNKHGNSRWHEMFTKTGFDALKFLTMDITNDKFTDGEDHSQLNREVKNWLFEKLGFSMKSIKETSFDTLNYGTLAQKLYEKAHIRNAAEHLIFPNKISKQNCNDEILTIEKFVKGKNSKK